MTEPILTEEERTALIRATRAFLVANLKFFGVNGCYFYLEATGWDKTWFAYIQRDPPHEVRVHPVAI